MTVEPRPRQTPANEASPPPTTAAQQPTPERPCLWQTAASMCARLHLNQWRKDGRTPYNAHPFRVALTLQLVFGITDEVLIAAAILHDVIEDTTADYDEVAEACGPAVAEIVAALTKDMRLQEDQREAAYDKQLARAGWQTQILKLADTYDNLCDSSPGTIRRKALDKAERALTIADEENPQVGNAADQLRLLITNFRARHSTAD